MSNLKVVLIGDNPHTIPEYATGNAFAANSSCDTLPATMRIILNDLAISYNNITLDRDTFDIELNHWTDQGVLLLNAALSTEKWKSGAHTMAWKPFMVYLLNELNKMYDNIVFVFMGAIANTLSPYVSGNKTMNEAHPLEEYYSNGHIKFKGVFKRINEKLETMGQTGIQWIV